MHQKANFPFVERDQDVCTVVEHLSVVFGGRVQQLDKRVNVSPWREGEREKEKEKEREL